MTTLKNKTELLKFRKEKDEFWKKNPQSPLTSEQKKRFKGLSYFPYDPKLRFVLSLDKNVPNVGSKVEIKTTKGDNQIYLKGGKIQFKVNGKDVEAIVLEDPEQEQYQYYLLFKDQTTGEETYENGRMLQIEKDPSASSGQGKLIIDFNYAYNPYSSYNDNWGCPITPKENFLSVRIEAGEKNL